MTIFGIKISDKLEKGLYIGIIVASIGFWVVYLPWSSNSMKKHKHYTIGIITGTSPSLTNGKEVDYYYIVNNKKYTSSDFILNDTITSNCYCRFYVKFNAKHPTNSELQQFKPVPNSIKSAPPNGWKKIPGE